MRDHLVMVQYSTHPYLHKIIHFFFTDFYKVKVKGFNFYYYIVTVRAHLTETLITLADSSAQEHAPTQNSVFLNSHTSSLFLYSH